MSRPVGACSTLEASGVNGGVAPRTPLGLGSQLVWSLREATRCCEGELRVELGSQDECKPSKPNVVPRAS